jgi:hypothetical protein
MKKATSSNTKSEILDIYEQLLNDFETEQKENKGIQKQLEEKEKLLLKAQEFSQKSSFSLDDLKTAFINQIDEFKQKFEEEKQKFSSVQDALQIQKQELENFYSVKAKAESLDALILTHKNAKEKLEEEIAQTKQNWDREKEEKEYSAKLRNRNDEDAYQTQKQKLEQELKDKKIVYEKEIAERQNAIKEKETFFEEMKLKISELETQLVTNVSNKEKEVTENLTKEFNFAIQLENKDLETEIKLLKLEIETLKNKVNEQSEIIAALNLKQAAASNQVQEIALKAIEGSGKRVEYITEKSKEN